MKLWLARHAYAGDSVDGDPQGERERPLKKQGLAMARAIAQQMVANGEIPDVIIASTLVRAQMTADILGAATGATVDLSGDLSPHLPITDWLLTTIADNSIKRLMVLCHRDNIDPMMQSLAGGDDWPGIVMGEVRRVEMVRQTGQWSLKWQCKPSDLGLKDFKK